MENEEMNFPYDKQTQNSKFPNKSIFEVASQGAENIENNPKFQEIIEYLK